MKCRLVRRLKKFSPTRVANALYDEGYYARKAGDIDRMTVGLPRCVLERAVSRLENRNG